MAIVVVWQDLTQHAPWEEVGEFLKDLPVEEGFVRVLKIPIRLDFPAALFIITKLETTQMFISTVDWLNGIL